MDTIQKSIWWEGSSKEELLTFPDAAVQDVGYQLHRLQQEKEPEDWKPLQNLGKGITGVYEIRVWQAKTTFRVAYATKFRGYVVVLHCFGKKTQTTTKADKDIIVDRYKSAKEKIK